MGRRSQTRRLDVWMNGEPVGAWTLASRGGDEFRYADAWLDSPNARPLSLSMPLRSKVPYRGEGVRNFFDNLLPDTVTIRQKIQRRFGTASTEAFDLLEIGRDCVGAVALVPPGLAWPDPRQIEGLPLDQAAIEQLLRRTRLSPTLGQPDTTFRISLAGAQDKTALLWHEHQWHEPVGATPSTHIFKLPMGLAAPGIDLSTSVENEWLCHRLLQAYDIPVAGCQMASFGAEKVLIVERFDRRLAPGGEWIVRLPQEDLCQATARPPGQKYEAEGGPGIREVLELLLGSTAPDHDRADFFKTQFVYWLLCAIDGHAKNFSIFLEAGGRFRLTPRYDVLSAYPVLSPGQLSPHEVTMAMAAWGKNRHYRWAHLKRRHWQQVGLDCQLQSAKEILDAVLEATPGLVEAVANDLPEDFPAEVAEPILEGVLKTARQA